MKLFDVVRTRRALALHVASRVLHGASCEFDQLPIARGLDPKCEECRQQRPAALELAPLNGAREARP